MSNQEPKPYSVKYKTNQHGNSVPLIFVPTPRGGAWIELLLEYPLPDEVLGTLLNPEVLPKWKVTFLEGMYLRFREVENARKRGDISYSDFTYESESLYLVAASTQPATPEKTLETRESLGEILLPLTVDQRRYLIATVGGESDKYMQVAKAENPDATPAALKKEANRIRSVVNRAKKQIEKNYRPRTN